MKIEGSYTLAGTPAAVYQALQDPAVLAQCIPGCQALTAASDGAYDLKLKVALAALSGDFAGKVRIEDPVPPSRYRIRVEASGRLGFLKAAGHLRVSASGEDECSVAYDGEVTVGGTIAAVGQRLLDTTARMMIRRFFEKFASLDAKSKTNQA